MEKLMDTDNIRYVDPEELKHFRDYVRAGKVIEQNSREIAMCHHMTQRANFITAEINGAYHTPKEIHDLLEELTCSEVPENVGIVPPFTTDFGANIQFGEGVYVNAGVSMQDQGGITIGDGALIGHHVVLATLNHDLAPSRRHDLIPKPIVIGKNVWIGANATILQDVTIGDNAVVAAGAVVNKDVPPMAVVGGVPAKIIRYIENEE